MDRERTKATMPIHEQHWRSTCQQLPWLNCFEMGLFRYFDPKTDKWVTDDNKPNPELHGILKVQLPLCGIDPAS
jgi:hypothetical protein